jgi:5S rRNA maturation endonuclease (ribonuclease M5)
MLDLSKLHRPRIKGGKTIAQCPACAETGGDTSADHLFINADGKFGCVLYPSTDGDQHRKRIFELVGLPDERPQTGKRNYTPLPHAPASAPPPDTAHWKHGRASASWTYRTASGQIAFMVARFDVSPTKKEILPLTWCRDDQGRESWQWKAPASPSALYGQPFTGDTVVVVEGEKTANAVIKAGFEATTWQGGSSAYSKADWSILKGKRVIIWPDNDQPGERAANAINETLKKIAASISTVKIPDGSPAGWDAADTDAETIRKIIDTASIPDVFEKPESPAPAPAIDYYHEPSEKFLVLNESGRWLSLSTASYKRILTSRGVTTAKNGAPMSEADALIVHAQSHNDIVRYGPLCGRNPGFYEENGIRHLVTEPMRLIEPIMGKLEVIPAILKGLLVDNETPEVGASQLNTLLGWMQSSARALRAGRYQQQQAITIAGPRNCGKSLIQHQLITPCLAGRAVDGEKYFLRNNDFNADLYRAEHITLDDKVSSTKIADRLAFAAKLKGATVGTGVGDIHGKGRDGVALRPWWRISITCNDQPENLLVLPPLNADVSDKIIILRASNFTLPMPVNTQAEKERFQAAIRAELPAFMHFLLNVYQLPEEYQETRYEVATYHHPELAELLDGLSPEAELLSLIDATMSNQIALGSIWISADELENRIREAQPSRAAKIFTYSQACAKYLHRLSVKHPHRIEKERTASKRGWLIKGELNANDLHL